MGVARSGLGGHFLGLLPGVVERADVHEAVFRKIVAFAIAEAFEGVDGLFERRGDAWEASEDLGHEEGLGKEAFDLPSTGDGELVFFAEFIDARMAMMSWRSLYR